MEYKQNTPEKGSVKIILDSPKGLWDLVLAAPSTYLGKGVYEVPSRTLEVLDKKGVAYKIVNETSAR